MSDNLKLSIVLDADVGKSKSNIQAAINNLSNQKGLQLNMKLGIDNATFSKFNSQLASIKTQIDSLGTVSVKPLEQNLRLSKDIVSDYKALAQALKEVGNISSKTNGNNKITDKKLEVMDTNQIKQTYNEINKLESSITKLQSKIQKNSTSKFIDTKELQNSQSTLDNLSAKLKALQSMSREDLLKLNPQQLQSYKSEIANVERAVNTLINTGKNTKDLFKDLGVDKLYSQFQKLKSSLPTSEVDRLEKEFKDLYSLSPDKLSGGVKKLKGEMEGLKTTTNNTGSSMKNFATGLLDNLKTFQLGTLIVQGIRTSIREIKETVVELDDAMRDLRKVAKVEDIGTKELADGVKKQSIAMAKELGISSKEMMTSIYEAIKLGFNDMSQAQEVAKQIMTLANVGDMGAEEATAQITTLINAFDLDVVTQFKREVDGVTKSYTQLTDAIDLANHIGNGFPIATDGLISAMQDSASVASAYGVEMQELAGMITAANASMQDTNKVGTGIRTLMLRMSGQDYDRDAGDLAYDKIGEAVKKLAGIDISNFDGTLKSMPEVLDLLSEKWSSFSEDTQQGLAKVIGGARQAETLMAVMKNWDMYKEVVSDYDSGKHLGSAEAELKQFIDSISGAMEQLKTTFTSIINTLIDGDMVKNMIQGFTSFVTFIDNVLQALDKVGMALPAVILGFTGLLKVLQAMTVSGIASFGTQVASSMGLATAAMTTTTGASVGLGAALKAGGLGLTGWVGIALAAGAAALTLGNSIATARKEASKEIEIKISSNKEKINNLGNTRKSLDELVEQYETLSKGAGKSKQKSEELAKVLQEIEQLDPTMSLVEYDEKGNPIGLHKENVESLKKSLDEAIEKEERLLGLNLGKQSKETQFNLNPKEQLSKSNGVGDWVKNFFGILGTDAYDLYKAERKFKKELDKLGGESVLQDYFNTQHTGLKSAKNYTKDFEKFREVLDNAYENYTILEESFATDIKKQRESALNTLSKDRTFKNLTEEKQKEVKDLINIMDFTGFNQKEQERVTKKLTQGISSGKIDSGELVKQLTEIKTAFVKGEIDMNEYASKFGEVKNNLAKALDLNIKKKSDKNLLEQIMGTLDPNEAEHKLAELAQIEKKFIEAQNSWKNELFDENWFTNDNKFSIEGLDYLMELDKVPDKLKEKLKEIKGRMVKEGRDSLELPELNFLLGYNVEVEENRSTVKKGIEGLADEQKKKVEKTLNEIKVLNQQMDYFASMGDKDNFNKVDALNREKEEALINELSKSLNVEREVVLDFILAEKTAAGKLSEAEQEYSKILSSTFGDEDTPIEYNKQLLLDIALDENTPTDITDQINKALEDGQMTKGELEAIYDVIVKANDIDTSELDVDTQESINASNKKANLLYRNFTDKDENKGNKSFKKFDINSFGKTIDKDIKTTTNKLSELTIKAQQELEKNGSVSIETEVDLAKAKFDLKSLEEDKLLIEAEIKYNKQVEDTNNEATKKYETFTPEMSKANKKAGKIFNTKEYSNQIDTTLEKLKGQKELKVKLKEDTTDLDKQIAAYEKDKVTIEAEIKAEREKDTNTFDSLTKSITTAEQKIEQINNKPVKTKVDLVELENQERKLEQLKQEKAEIIVKYKAEIEGSLQETQAKIDELTTEKNTIEISTDGDTAASKKRIEEINTELKQLEDKKVNLETIINDEGLADYEARLQKIKEAGDTAIQITADSTQANTELQNTVNNINNTKGQVKVEADTSSADATIKAWASIPISKSVNFKINWNWGGLGGLGGSKSDSGSTFSLRKPSQDIAETMPTPLNDIEPVDNNVPVAQDDGASDSGSAITPSKARASWKTPVRVVNKSIDWLMWGVDLQKKVQNQIQAINNELDLLNEKLTNIYGSTKLKYMKEQIALLEKQKNLHKELQNELTSEQEKLKKFLASQGFKFGEDGNIENYVSKLQEMNKKLDSIKNEKSYESYQDNLNEIQEALDRYLDITFSELPDAVKEWESLENQIKDIYKEQLEVAKETEDKIKEIYEKQLQDYKDNLQKQTEAKQKAIEKQVKAELDAIEELRKAYNEQKSEEDFEKELEEKRKELNELEKKLASAGRDNSAKGKANYENLLEEYENLQKELDDFLEDREREVVNKLFDDEADRLNKESEKEIEKLQEELDKALEKLEQTYTPEKIMELVKQAMASGQFEGIDGSIQDLEEVMLHYINSTGEGLGATGQIIKNELIGNLNIAKDVLKEIDDISQKLGLTMYTNDSSLFSSSNAKSLVPQVVSDIQLPDITSRGIIEGLGTGRVVNFNESFVNIEGDITKDVMPDLERLLKGVEQRVAGAIINSMR